MRNLAAAVRLGAMLAFFCTISVNAQSTAKPQAQTQELLKQYQSCPGGYYAGPRPGKTRYTKDSYIWTVTPAFAERYCMPPEFVSADLKGAEAVAVKIATRDEEIICGFADNKETCGGEINWRVEIYIKDDVKLPRRNDHPAFQFVTMHSKFLINQFGKEEKEFETERVKKLGGPPPGSVSPFENTQVGITGVKNGVAAWPIMALYQRAAFKGVLAHHDYYAFEGSTGFFTNPRMEKLDIRQFVIAMAKLGSKSHWQGQTVENFAHLIELPESFSDKIRAMDKQFGGGMAALARQAFKLPADSAKQ